MKLCENLKNLKFAVELLPNWRPKNNTTKWEVNSHLLPMSKGPFQNFWTAWGGLDLEIWGARVRDYGYHFPIPTVFFRSRPLEQHLWFRFRILWFYEGFKHFPVRLVIKKWTLLECPIFDFYWYFELLMVFIILSSYLICTGLLWLIKWCISLNFCEWIMV